MVEPVFGFGTRDEGRRSDEEFDRQGMERLSTCAGTRVSENWICRRGSAELTEDVSERFVELDELCHHASDDVILICGCL